MDGKLVFCLETVDEADETLLAERIRSVVSVGSTELTKSGGAGFDGAGSETSA
jgi:hypothetical protein